MNAAQREKRLDDILDEIIEKDVEEFHREAIERHKARQREQELKAEERPEPVRKGDAKR